MLRVGLLGTVELCSATGEAVAVPSQLGRVVLASLALSAPHARSVASLVDDVWGDAPPEHPRAALQSVLSRLRALSTPGLIESTPAGYRLAISADESDLGLAESAVEAARGLVAADALARVDEALRLWRGEAGTDLPESSVTQSLAARSAVARRALKRIRARALVELDRSDEALEMLDALAEASPFDESIQLDILRAAVAAGRPALGLERFAMFREVLASRLGADPSQELVEAHAAILRGAEGRTSSPSHGEQTSTLRLGLRASSNPILGRERDVQRVRGLLASHRLVTLLGSGGLGKTRLSQEIASGWESSVVVVELASVSSGDDVGLLIASTLGIREARAGRRLGEPVVLADLRQRIIDLLGARRTLLVLDNCEHVIGAASEWAAELMAGAPALTILATSRSPLVIAGEQVYSLEPLRSRGEDGRAAEAVELFVARARAARPSAELPLDVVDRLCDRLDGLPLAIELAAARVRSLSLSEIESRLVDRFALLSLGDRSAPERHRTLLAVIDWSWNLLASNEQHLLVRLCRFADGFSLETAEWMMRAAGRDGSAADALDGLVSQSLVAVSETAGVLRYRMLETVREFGALKLPDLAGDEALQRDEFEWAIELAIGALDSWLGPRQLVRLRESAVSVEQENLVALLRRAMAADDRDAAVSIYAALAYLWTLRGAHSEVLAFGAPVMSMLRGLRPQARIAQLAMLAGVLTGATFNPDGFSTAVRAGALIRRIAKEHRIVYPPLAAIVEVVLTFDDLSSAFQAMAANREHPDARTAMFGNVLSAQLAENDGYLDEARGFALGARRMAEVVGDDWGRAMSSQILANLSSEQGDPDGALEWCRRAIYELAEIGAAYDLQQLDWIMAIAMVDLGELAEAEHIFDRLASVSEGADVRMLNLNGFAGLAEVELRRAGMGLQSTDRSTEADHRSRGLALYRRALALAEGTPDRIRPEALVALAATLTVQCVMLERHARAADRADATTDGERLRVRLLVDRRRRGFGLDRPVLGAAVIALARWAADVLDERGLGVELVTLAAGISPRQDVPSMRLALHEAHLAGLVGADEFERARRAAAALTRGERVERLYEILGSRQLRLARG